MRALAGPGYFPELRVEPYYETTAKRHPDLNIVADFVPRTLVHGDYSPKNILVHKDGLWVLDHEVAHWGDPVFDLAFMLNHLLIKAYIFADARYRDAHPIHFHSRPVFVYTLHEGKLVVDDGGCILAANQSALVQLGATPGELRGTLGVTAGA